MTEARNSLEQELKHNEKEFASLVTEELEQRFARFENTTLAAVSKIGGGAGDSSSASSAAFAPYCSPLGVLQHPSMDIRDFCLVHLLLQHCVPAACAFFAVTCAIGQVTRDLPGSATCI